MIDIDAYFDRIGYSGSTDVRLGTLSGLHRRHPEAIPFENLNPFLGLPVNLDTQALQTKLVQGGRGGWCFEHNLLFSHVLRQLGFDVRWLAARVMWGMPEGGATPRTHMVLRVDIDGDAFIADVGFGGMSLTAPLRLVAGKEQSTPHGAFRLLEDGTYLVLQADVRGEWMSLYRFEQHEQLKPDYELTNWYLCHSPNSRFVANVLCARVDEGHRYALFNNDFAVHPIDGPSERRRIDDAVDLMDILEKTFGILLPDPPRLQISLQELIRRVSASRLD